MENLLNKEATVSQLFEENLSVDGLVQEYLTLHNLKKLPKDLQARINLLKAEEAAIVKARKAQASTQKSTQPRGHQGPVVPKESLDASEEELAEWNSYIELLVAHLEIERERESGDDPKSDRKVEIFYGISSTKHSDFDSYHRL